MDNGQTRMKIGSLLAEWSEGAGDEERTEVAVWFSDTDLEPAREIALAKIGMTGEAFEELTASDYQAVPGNDIVQDYIKAKRSASSEIYREHNAEFAVKLLTGYDIRFSSLLSPVVVAALNPAAVRSLADSEDVMMMERADIRTKSTFNVSKPTIRADTAQSSYSVTGAGVKIGMVEAYGVPDLSKAGLSGANIIIPSVDTGSPNNHASVVAEIIAGKASGSIPSGIAHGSTLYARNLPISGTETTLLR